jgi:hypothetical protein
MSIPLVVELKTDRISCCLVSSFVKMSILAGFLGHEILVSLAVAFASTHQIARHTLFRLASS